jgi:hypothetical protein
MIWEHAYKHQISDPSKHLLLAVLSLPSIVHLTDCKKAFERLRKQYCSDFGESRVHNEFNVALKECEGNFLRIDLAASRQTLQFHNPSIRDYLTYYLSCEIDLQKVLIQSFQVFDQPVSLWNSFEPLVRNPLQENEDLVLLFQKKLASTLGSASVRLIRYSIHDGSFAYSYAKYSTHDQVRFILNEDVGSVCRALRDKTKETLADMFSNLDSIYDWSDIASLLSAIKGAEPEYELNIADYLDRTLSVLPHNLNQVADYRQLADICKEHTKAFASLEVNFKYYGESLDEGLEDELRYISSVDDIGTLEECADDIQRVADVFNVDLSNGLSRVQELIQEIEQEEGAEKEEPIKRRLYSPVADDPELIMSMFETLN